MDVFRGIEHVGLLTIDPAGLAEWYERVLGFRVIYRTDAAQPAYFLSGSGGMIEIVPSPGGPGTPPSPAPVHLAIAVDDFDRAVEHLKEQGVSLEEPLEIFLGGKVAFFMDPAGNRLHLIYRPVTPWR